MEFNISFNKEIEYLISSCTPLVNWFERNQELMIYFEDENTNYDIKVLERMTNDSLTWLETKLPYTDEDKARYAAMSIAFIYDIEKENLSDLAKKMFYIDIESLDKKEYNKIKIKKNN